MEIEEQEKCPFHEDKCPHPTVDECEIAFLSNLRGVEKWVDSSESDYDQLPGN